MKKWIMPLTIVLVVIAAMAYAYEREQMSIDEATVSKIKNAAGTTVIDVGAGTSTLTNTGHATLDLPLAGGNMTGPIKQRSGAAPKFPNLSTARIWGPLTGNVTGDVTGTHTGASFGNHSGVTTKTGTLELNGHTLTNMTSTINGVLRHIYVY